MKHPTQLSCDCRHDFAHHDNRYLYVVVQGIFARGQSTELLEAWQAIQWLESEQLQSLFEASTPLLHNNKPLAFGDNECSHCAFQRNHGLVREGLRHLGILHVDGAKESSASTMLRVTSTARTSKLRSSSPISSCFTSSSSTNSRALVLSSEYRPVCFSTCAFTFSRYSSSFRFFSRTESIGTSTEPLLW